VPAAGVVASTGNHLVVLDLSGRELRWLTFDETGAEVEWPWAAPPEWQPSTLADAELVACIQADQATTMVEVCRYAGGARTVARYDATRQVVVVEAASGLVRATFAITRRANVCDVLEKSGTTALYGDVSPEVVWGYLADLVERETTRPSDDPLPWGQEVLDQLGPWGLESAAAAFPMDLLTLRSEIGTMDSGESLESIATEASRDYPVVRAGIHDGVKTRLDARVAADSMTADVEAFTLQRLDTWLAAGGRPVSP
jgi:hypothetical protein